MNVIRNEQTKLTATFLNGIATAIFAVGGVAPMISSLNGGIAPRGVLIAVSGVCFLAALALHLIARRVLERLET